jgi:hypothetical protein
MRIAFGLATPGALLLGLTLDSWAQGPGSIGPTGPTSPGVSGSFGSTIFTTGVLVVIAVAIVVVARYSVLRRKRKEEAVILQSQLSDALAREVQLRGLQIIPKSHVSGWRQARVTLEVAGEVPTPEIRETVMRIARAEVRRFRPDVIPEDCLFIVPPVHQELPR